MSGSLKGFHISFTLRTIVTSAVCWRRKLMVSWVKNLGVIQPSPSPVPLHVLKFLSSHLRILHHYNHSLMETFNSLPHQSSTEPVLAPDRILILVTLTPKENGARENILAWSHITIMTKVSIGYSVGPAIQLHSPSEFPFLLSKMMILYCSMFQ